MRWHSAPLSFAGWLGIAFTAANASFWRQAAILIILFVGWGINQVINDILGLNEDRINAPHRPTVSGRLDINFAILLSLLLFLAGLIISFLLNKQAALIYILIFALNIAYERAKRMPILGNIAFGLPLATCVYYAAMCAGKMSAKAAFLNSALATLTLLVWAINFVLCFFSDFKDYEGDKTAGVKTLVVALGIKRAKYFGLLLVSIPFLLTFLCLKLRLLYAFSGVNYTALMLGISSVILIYCATAFFRNPAGEKAYYSLKWVILAAVLFQISILGLVNVKLASILFVLSFIYVQAVFGLYKDNLA